MALSSSTRSGCPVTRARSRDEIVKHLAGLVDTNVEVRVEISATSEEGFPDDVIRIVTENARTLKFDPLGFEES